MKKIIVVSDSHCDTFTIKHIANLHPDAFAYLHAGDSQDFEVNLSPFITVKGNNDYYINTESRIINIDFLKIYMTHGHRMYLSEENMVNKAKSADCNMFIFGHTHRPYYEVIDGIHLLNPGATSFPRSPIGRTYAIITLKENEQIDVSFEKL